jgi:hypothetical protein
MPKTLVDDRVRLEAFAWRAYVAVRQEWQALVFTLDLVVEQFPQLEFRMEAEEGGTQRYRCSIEQGALDGHPAYVDEVVGALRQFVPAGTRDREELRRRGFLIHSTPCSER